MYIYLASASGAQLVRAADEELASMAAILEMLAGPLSNDPGLTPRPLQ